jgi:acetylornithine deacetylase/succinyl-diaminopimelate desuccinylase family protein
MARESDGRGTDELATVLHELNEQSVESLLGDLVRIPSHDRESEVAEYLADRFALLGVSCRTTPVEGVARPNLVARWGEGPHSLLLNTHMDTVPTGERSLWSHDPYAGDVADGRLYGRGATDAKGCLAAMVSAFEAVVRSGRTMNGVLTLTAVACEETRGRGTRKVVEEGLRVEAAVVGEPTSLRVHIAHKGVLRLRIAMSGRAAHASRPDEGVNAIAGMAALVVDLERLADRIAGSTHALLGHATLTVTRIEGGQADNVVPERCVIGVDRRLLPGEGADEAQAQVQRVVSGVCERFPGLRADIEVTHDLHPAQTSPDAEIVRCGLRCSRDVTGSAMEPEGFPACCDMVYLSEAGIPTFILGPGDLAQAHVADEHVVLAQVRQAAEIYARLALGWLNR